MAQTKQEFSFIAKPGYVVSSRPASAAPPDPVSEKK